MGAWTNGRDKVLRMLKALLLTAMLGVPQDEGLTEDEAVALAKEALGAEVGMREGEVELHQVLSGQWRDSSLGCPRAGEAYLPAITSGYRVFLKEAEDSSRLHEVHVAPSGAVVCETVDLNVVKTMPKAQGDELARRLRDAPKLAGLATEDLASRLGIDESDIDVSISARTWSDTSLGCPEPEKRYEKDRIEGFLITLEVEEETYEYHANKERVILCEYPEERDRR